MAVSFNAVTSAQATSASSIAVSHTASGTDRAAFVGVGTSAAVVDLTSSVTYPSSGTITELWDATFETYLHISGHSVIAPPASAETVTATLAGTQDELTIGVISLTGVHQTTPTNTVPSLATGNSGTATSNAITSATDELVCANMYNGWAGAAPGGGETERWDQIVAGSVTGWGATEPGAASVVCSATRTAGGFAGSWGIIGVSFKVAAGGGGFTAAFRKTLSGLGAGVGKRQVHRSH